jgi:hypothetical protein
VTKINRPDTRLTELREIKRRLRLLEAARMRPPTAALLAAATTGPTPTAQLFAAEAPATGDPVATDSTDAGRTSVGPVPLMPARPTDWPGTASLDWERLAVTWVVRGAQEVTIALHLSAEPNTVGAVRVLLDGEPVGSPLPVAPTPAQQRVAIPGATTVTVPPAESEIAVEARRTRGDGLIRVAALLLPS